MIKVKVSIEGFTDYQNENQTVRSVCSDLGEDFWINFSTELNAAIQRGDLLDRIKYQEGTAGVIEMTWTNQEAREQYMELAQSSLILSKLKELGYSVSETIEEL